MARFIVAPEAEEDLFQIWLYLLREADRGTADRIEDEILAAFSALAGTPGKGHRRSDSIGTGWSTAPALRSKSLRCCTASAT